MISVNSRLHLTYTSYCTQNTPHKTHKNIVYIYFPPTLTQHLLQHLSLPLISMASYQSGLNKRVPWERELNLWLQRLVKYPPIQWPCLDFVASLCSYMVIHISVPARAFTVLIHHFSVKWCTLSMACTTSHNSQPNMVVEQSVTLCVVTWFVFWEEYLCTCTQHCGNCILSSCEHTTDQPSEQHTAPSQHENEEGRQKRRDWAKSCT